MTTPSFEAFVRAHHAALIRLARVLSADRTVADDIVGAVLERALTRWEQIGPLESPAGYVRQMVVNEHLSWRRRVRTLTTASRTLAARTPAGGAVAPDTPVEAVLAREQRERLIASLRKLPPRQRITLALRYYEGLSDREIADLLSTTPSTVRSNAARGLAALRISAVHDEVHDDDHDERPVR